MTDTKTRRSLPFLRVCLKPRDTISSIIAHLSESQIALLAILGGLAGVTSWLTDYGAVAALGDWRILGAGIAFGVLAGLLNVYALGWLLICLGRWMGSSATCADGRAALAWGQTPNIIGVVVVLVSMAVLGNAPPSWFSLSSRLLLGLCAIWSVVATVLMLSRVLAIAWWRSIGVYVLGGLVCPLLAAGVVRTLLFQPFNIPATSMSPTLLTGDYLFVSKFAYGYSGYSLPFTLPGLEGRIFPANPRPGDVIVFAPPQEPSTRYIKRVVAVAGDHVQMKVGQLYINGVAATRERLGDISGDAACSAQAATAKRWRETLQDRASYETLDCVEDGLLDNTAEYIVPPGHVFVLGDNRDNSSDSRVLSTIGYVPLQNIVGRAEMIFFSSATDADKRAMVRFDRIGKMVR